MRYLCEHNVCKRRGGRKCLQRAIAMDKNGRRYCYYHDPEKPRRFGEGYSKITAAEAKAKGE